MPRAAAILVALALVAADKAEIQSLLSREVISPRQAQLDVEAFAEARLPRMPPLTGAAEWTRYAERLRGQVLDRVVFRGEAAAWRDRPLRVEWLETIPGGPGYRIKKLRYEALPDLWIPALLYEPEKLTGKVPVVLNVNGHDGDGKAAGYKQIRCINVARRGMLALNPEWLGMGQLRGTNYVHYRMNQLDLCGTSGLAPFYLAMRRGLDVLLSLEHADPERVAVSGLSGGGWQTIFLSALDPRVKLANPVAGYSGFRTRIRHHKDLGDSEQTPCDLATVADYTHLTALMAPRPTLLTYNAKDDCCFEAGYALPPLLDAAGPAFRLFDRGGALRSHVNHDPGTHNFEKDNRQAFYRMLGDFFYPGDKTFNPQEIPCPGEVKTREQLAVGLPAKNADFHSLALALSANLPRRGERPADVAAARRWQAEMRGKLRTVVAAREYAAEAEVEPLYTSEKSGVRATAWRLKLGKDWTVPVVELAQGEPKRTAILLSDAGRQADPGNATRLVNEGYRVLAVDPFYFGESKLTQRDLLFALLVAAVGERPLGIQASQVAAVARWAARKYGPVALVAVGPRCGTFTLVAAALEEKAVAAVEIHGALGSLREVIEQNRSVEQTPELFCFGLLESFDVRELAMLTAPRPVRFVAPGQRAQKEMTDLRTWYALFGVVHEPLNQDAPR